MKRYYATITIDRRTCHSKRTEFTKLHTLQMKVGSFTWEVTKIEDVTEVYKSENKEAAKLFLDWEGGFGKNCKSCECEI